MSTPTPLAGYQSHKGLPQLAGLCTVEEAAKPGLGVEECVRRLKRFHYAFKRLHQILTARITAEPIYELKTGFSHHAYLCAEHVTALRTRIGEMREPPLGLEDVPHPALEAFFDEILAAPTTEELIEGAYRTAIDRLWHDVRKYADDTNPLTDAPSRRVLRFVELEVNDAANWGASVASCLVEPNSDRERNLAEWTKYLGSLLDLAGGLDGTGLVENRRAQPDLQNTAEHHRAQGLENCRAQPDLQNTAEHYRAQGLVGRAVPDAADLAGGLDGTDLVENRRAQPDLQNTAEHRRAQGLENCRAQPDLQNTAEHRRAQGLVGRAVPDAADLAGGLDGTGLVENRRAQPDLQNTAEHHRAQGLVGRAVPDAAESDPQEIPRRYSKTPYQYDAIPRRDERFTDPWNQGVNAESFLYNPAFPARVKALMMLYKRLREIDVPEMMASIIAQTPGKPWGYYRDMSRQLWDEARHAMMGEVGFVALGVDWTKVKITFNWSYRLNTECTPKERHGVLYFIEQGLMPKTGKRYEFETGQASGLPLIATLQDFDWADEVLHSQIGRQWYVPEFGTLQKALEYGDRAWSKVLSNWATVKEQGLTNHENWWPVVYAQSCRAEGVAPDPTILAFDETYEGKRADLQRVAAE